MAAGQLWLFPPPKPLVERFGDAFFRALPSGSGVYFLCGASEGVLYVGKARNLRKRLSSYRVANPERLPRAVIPIIASILEGLPYSLAGVVRDKALFRVRLAKARLCGFPGEPRLETGLFCFTISQSNPVAEPFAATA